MPLEALMGIGQHVWPHQAAENRRQEGGDYGESGQNGGGADCIHRCGMACSGAVGRGHVAVNVLHHHYGVIHQYADGKISAKSDTGEVKPQGPGGEQR